MLGPGVGVDSQTPGVAADAAHSIHPYGCRWIYGSSGRRLTISAKTHQSAESVGKDVTSLRISVPTLRNCQWAPAAPLPTASPDPRPLHPPRSLGGDLANKTRILAISRHSAGHSLRITSDRDSEMAAAMSPSEQARRRCSTASFGYFISPYARAFNITGRTSGSRLSPIAMIRRQQRV